MALQRGDAVSALAGGVNVISSPDVCLTLDVSLSVRLLT